jgi:TolA-binding protein
MSSCKILIPFLVLVTSLPGCVSHWHGREMRSDILALRGQMDQLVDAHRSQKKQLNETIKAFESRLNAIDKNVDRSIGNLRTTSANSGSTLDELRKMIQDFRGELAEIKFKNVQNTQDLDGLKPPKSAPLPQGRRALFNFGAKHFEGGDCSNAIRAFEMFSQRFKTDANTDNALAMVGDCHIQQGHYRDALRTLKVILDDYPKGEKVDDALFLMHQSLVGLGKCKKAKAFLETLVSDHPKSNRIKPAKSALKALNKSCR